MTYNYNNISLIDINFNKYENKILLQKILYISFIGLIIIFNIINFLTKYITSIYIPILSFIIIIFTILKYVNIIKRDNLINYLYNTEKDIKYIYVERDKIIVKYKTKKNIFKTIEIKKYDIIYTNENENLLDIINNKLYLKVKFDKKYTIKEFKKSKDFLKEYKINTSKKFLLVLIVFNILSIFLLRNILLSFLFIFVWSLIFILLFFLRTEFIEDFYNLKEINRIEKEEVLFVDNNNLYLLEGNIYKKLNLNNFRIKINNTKKQTLTINIKDKIIE